MSAQLPPIPEPGFYWAKLSGDLEWTVVEVCDRHDGKRVTVLGNEADGRWSVAEWGPCLVPPR